MEIGNIHEEIKPNIFYDGSILDINEAGALLLKKVFDNFGKNCKGMNPVKVLSGLLNKDDKTIYRWFANWASSGHAPTVYDFIRIIYITKDPIFIEFFLNIIDGDLEEMQTKYSNKGREVIEAIDLLKKRIMEICSIELEKDIYSKNKTSQDPKSK